MKLDVRAVSWIESGNVSTGGTNENIQTFRNAVPSPETLICWLQHSALPFERVLLQPGLCRVTQYGLIS